MSAELGKQFLHETLVSIQMAYIYVSMCHITSPGIIFTNEAIHQQHFDNNQLLTSVRFQADLPIARYFVKLPVPKPRCTVGSTTSEIHVVITLPSRNIQLRRRQRSLPPQLASSKTGHRQSRNDRLFFNAIRATITSGLVSGICNGRRSKVSVENDKLAIDDRQERKGISL